MRPVLFEIVYLLPTHLTSLVSRKSTLVNQAIVNWDGCIVTGKFDKAVRPDSVLATALDSFFGGVLEETKLAEGPKLSLKWRIMDAVGSMDSGSLLDMLPNLKSWLSEGVGGVPFRSSENDAVASSAASSLRTKYSCANWSVPWHHDRRH